MKKLALALTTVFLLTALSLLTVFAAGTSDVVFSFGTADAEPDSIVEIPLSIQSSVDATTFGLTGLTYDTEALTFLGFTDYSALAESSVIGTNGFDDSKQTIVLGFDPAQTVNGELCSLVFQVNSAALGDYSITAESPVVKNVSEDVSASVAAGNIHVEPKEIAQITAQPESITTAPAAVYFTVTAEGKGLTYQWAYLAPGASAWTDSTAADANTAVLSVNASEENNGYQYRCTVKDSYGNTVVSDPALLTVKTVKITAQPENITTAPGTVYFSVTAEGTGLTYQWSILKPGASAWTDSTASTAKSATTAVNARDAINGYQYRCTVKDSYGNTVVSDAALLTVNTLKITAQPKNITTAPGTVYFSVTAEGTGLTYQWSILKPGASTWTNSTSKTAKNAKTAVDARDAINGYKYRCTVKDSYGNTVVSDAALLTVNTLKITAQPKSITTAPGTVYFSVTAEGTGLTYQWSILKPGATSWTNSTSKTAKNAKTAVDARDAINGYKYRCTVKDSYGNTVVSDAALLTVNPLTITAQPKNITTAPGTVYFSVTAEGTGLTYQWSILKPGASTWTNSTAKTAKSATLSVNARDALNGYQFRCTVKDSSGNTVVSDAALLTVNPLTITVQPKNITTAPGTVYFSVTAEGTGLTYQWSILKPGASTWTNSTAKTAKSATLSVNARDALNGYQFRCTVKDSSGNTVVSEPALLTVSTLKIVSQSNNITTTPATIHLTVIAEGTGLTYQWSVLKPGASSWTNSTADSAKTPYYTTNARDAINGYQFRCTVKDQNGMSVVSDPILLTVI